MDLRRILGGEGAALTAAEKWACHGDVSPYSPSSRLRRPSPSRPRPSPSPRERRSPRSLLRIMAEGPVSGSSTLMVRSEEHTSELQSLMRISYAVFCLKKKKKQSKLSTFTLKQYRTQ